MDLNRRSLIAGSASIAATVALPLNTATGSPIGAAGLAFDPAAPGADTAVRWTASWCEQEARWVVAAIDYVDNKLTDAALAA